MDQKPNIFRLTKDEFFKLNNVDKEEEEKRRSTGIDLSNDLYEGKLPQLMLDKLLEIIDFPALETSIYSA